MIAYPAISHRTEPVYGYNRLLLFLLSTHVVVSILFFLYLITGFLSQLLVVVAALGVTDVLYFCSIKYRLRFRGVIVVYATFVLVEYAGILCFNRLTPGFLDLSETRQLIPSNAQEHIKAGIGAVTAELSSSSRVSVVIPCRNEDIYISKTIQYTIENSPPELLNEIVVIDDASTNPLHIILEKELSPKHYRFVKVYRFTSQQGLIRSRIFGADISTSPNIVFLDGHCRPKPGWLPPLLRHLKLNYRRVACPVIQDIRPGTWEDVGTAGYKMMFEWNFEFGWYDDVSDEVPISAGGILAITRRWWEESGKYDPGMLEWGGENLEQSMRVWMCGGEIYVVRDSFVGHIFERQAKPNPGVRNQGTTTRHNLRHDHLSRQFLAFIRHVWFR